MTSPPAATASALATAEMRHQLTNDLGVRWRPGRKSGWEIEGITNQVVGEFSKRRNEIDVLRKRPHPLEFALYHDG